jgi:hypothetical protein
VSPRERIESKGRISHLEIDDVDMRTMDGLDEYLVTDWDPVDTDEPLAAILASKWHVISLPCA